MKIVNKLFGFIVLVTMIGSTCMPLVSCEGFVNAEVTKPGKKGNPDNPNVVVLNISQVTEWDCLAFVKDGPIMLFNVDESTGLLTRLFVKPDKDSDNGISFLYKENGLPDAMIANGYIFYFDNFNGYTFDMAVIKPDGTNEYHYGIETDENWDTFGTPLSMSAGGRSIWERDSIKDVTIIDVVNLALDCAGATITIMTCISALAFPPALLGCIIGGVSALAQLAVSLLESYEKISEGSAMAINIFGISWVNITMDAAGCAGKDVKDCISLLVGIASILFGDDFDFFNNNASQIATAKEEMDPPPTYANVSFHANGGSGTVPASRTVEKYSDITLPLGSGLSRTGFTFSGWSTSPNGRVLDGTSQLIVGSTSFYANWEPHFPGSPTWVTATTKSSRGITVSWEPVSNADDYYIYRSTSTSDDYVKVGSSWRAVPYLDTGLSAGTTYYYRVSCYNTKGESGLSGYAVATTMDGIYYEMVSIPFGSFMMGSPITEEYRRANETQHRVTLSAFQIGKYEVTQEQYQSVMGTNPSFGQSDFAPGEIPGKRPVDSVNWYEALVFCNTLSILEGLTPAYRIYPYGSGAYSTNPDDWGRLPDRAGWHDGDASWDSPQFVPGANGYRLPTEAQWEYACRAGTTTAYNNTGDTLSDDTGWLDFNSDNKMHEVGKKLPNAWGLYDMHGNVWEWCWDGADGNDYPSSAQTNPVGSNESRWRVIRGGCAWRSDALDMWPPGNGRSAYRGNYRPRAFTYGGEPFGLRLVLPAQ